MEHCLSAYFAQDPLIKCAQTFFAYENLPPEFVLQDKLDLPEPGRPPKPELVSPRYLKRRRLGTPEGIAALWHAIAHIEFNAINLALDAFLRFPGLPSEYYRDWLKVAKEEAYHFQLIQTHLESLGFPYGSFPAHSGLWEMAEKTAEDPLLRMGLVPRVMEARGLDVTPSIMQKLIQAGDLQAEAILGVILRDEVTHVAIGNKWFKFFCEQKGLPPLETFEDFAQIHLQTQLKGPYNHLLRAQAGFSLEELAWLENHYP